MVFFSEYLLDMFSQSVNDATDYNPLPSKFHALLFLLINSARPIVSKNKLLLFRNYIDAY